METGKRIILFCMALLLTSIFGCALNSSINSDKSGQRDAGKSRLPSIPGISKTMVEDGRSFQVTVNPIISYSVHGHYSSDPAVAVIHDYRSGKDILVLITSTDLVGVGDPVHGFPMNGIFLYTTYGENNLMTTWYEHGKSWNTGGIVDPIIQESDFSNWSKQGNSMFAPDIQFVEGVNDGPSQIYLYIPDVDKNGKWRIGIAHANTGTLDSNGQYQLYDKFTADNSSSTDYFNFVNGSGGSGFLIDPGVFYHSLGNQYYMLFTDTDYDKANGDKQGNISMARIYNDMRSGTNLGRIDFIPPYNKYTPLKCYMEGPDISVMTNKNGMVNYYLVFTIGKEGIGYAMADPVNFAFNPAKCWNFKGWLFHDTNSFKGNHVDLIQFNNKCYAFFQWSPYASQSRSRQVCCKEFELNDKGEIIGVTIPSNQNDMNDLKQYGAIDDTTKSITRGFVNIRDESIGNGGLSTVHISSLKNITGSSLSRFQLYYYFTIESGANMVLETNGNLLASGFTMLPLRHLGSKLWAVILDYNGSVLDNEKTLNADLSFKIHCTGGSNIKTNDFSQPVGDFNTWTTRIALKDENGNLLCGEQPDIPQGTTKYLRNAWSPDGKWSYLTLMSTDENSGIDNQSLNTGWTSQEWYVDDVSGTTLNITKKDGTKVTVTVPANAVKLRNLQPNNQQYYMTCNDKYDYKDGDGNYFWILSQAGHNDWSTQIWIKEPVYDYYGNNTGSVRLRCFWDTNNSIDTKPPYPLYLTRYSGDDPSHTYCKPLHKDSGLPSWTSQEWWIE